MDFRHYRVGFIPLLLSACLSAGAEEINLQPNHPQSYTVLNGDSLWDIAAKFLLKPEQWPKLWQNNRQIENPNLIYPGDVIALETVNGSPHLQLTSRISPRQVQEKLQPQIREIPHQEAITLIPTQKIAAYLTYPRVVTREELNAAPYVIGFVGDHLIAGIGDKVYVRGITSHDDINFSLFRQGITYSSPESGEVLGYEATFISKAILQQVGDPATLAITKAKSEIRPGDRLFNDEAREITLHYFPKPPDKPINGAIISIVDGVTQIGRDNIVALDKGKEDGLQIGHILQIAKRGKQISDPFSGQEFTKVSLPDEIAGKLMIFRVFPHISYAIILQATTRINLLDKVTTSE